MDLRDIICGIPLFKNLGDEELDMVAARLRKEHFAKGDILFREKDPGDTMYLVESGQLIVLGKDEQEPIAFMGPGNFVGDISLILAQPRTATVQVTIDAQLWLLDKKGFDDLINSRPAIALEMMRELSRRLVTTTRRKQKKLNRRITVLSGGQYGLKLSEAIYAHLKSPVAILPLPRSNPEQIIGGSGDGVMLLDAQDLTEDSLAESLSHQVEVYKHIVLILPDEPDPLARKALKLADAVVSVGPAPDWLSAEDKTPEVWITNDTTLHLMRIARKLTNRTVGLALSSGGTRGLAHVGVLKVLMEEDIPIDMVAGSSAGALFGALFAAGWNIDQMLEFIDNLKNLTHFTNWDFNLPPRTGIVKGRRARDKFLARPMQNLTFAQIETPLYIVAGDILTGEEFIFDSGSIPDAVRASAGIPVLGDPWLHQGRYLVDGGVVNPLPASVLRERGANIVIASNVVQPLQESYSGPTDQMPNILLTIFNIISAMEAEMIKKQFPLIDVLIHHGVSAKHSLDFEQANEMIQFGEQNAREMLPTIKAVIEAPPDE